MTIADFANACQAMAADLDQEQRALKYQGPQAVTLGKLSTNLSASASTLRTLVVSQALAGDAGAKTAISDATTAANQAAGNLKDAAAAIKIAGLVLSLGAAVITENPGAIISSATDLVKAVKAL